MVWGWVEALCWVLLGIGSSPGFLIDVISAPY